ncbi:MAG: hypothetical protein AAF821_00330 [Cyanobacteria bacterium P01_D01_bin.156]
MLLAVALLKPVAQRVGQRDDFTVEEMMQHLQQAYQRGRQSQLDPDRWQPEQLWNLPLDEVKAMFHV